MGIVIDPMAIHNYAMDDGNPEWSDAEKAQFDLAYAFGSFWCGATESLQARADQMFNDNGTIRTCTIRPYLSDMRQEETRHKPKGSTEIDAIFNTLK